MTNYGDGGLTVAQKILRSLGGAIFVERTGAKDFVGTRDGLQMSLPSAMTLGRINRMMITQTDETYTIQVGRLHRHEFTVIETRNLVRFFDLLSSIEDMTGLSLARETKM